MEKQKSSFFRNNKKLIKISVVLYLVIVLVVTGTTAAWFVTNKKVEVEPKDYISITADSRVEISADGDTWGSELQVVHSITQYADVSGDGIDFWFPRYLSDSDEVDMGNKDAFDHVNTSDPERNALYFVTLRLKVRSATKLDLYLDGAIGPDGQTASYVSPKETEKVEKNGVLSYSRPSPLHPDISADHIAAASRVAFVEVVDGEEVLRCLWIPNDKTELSYDADGVPSLRTNGNREQYGHIKAGEDSMENYKYSTDELASGTILVGKPQSSGAVESNGSVIPPMIGMHNPIVSFDGTKLEEKELIIRVWIEGTDREANATLNGGMMTYKFTFTGIVKDTPEEQTLTYTDNGLFYDTLEATDLVYSVNAIDWNTYSNLTLKNVPDVTVFYVRKAETPTSKAGVVYRVDRVAKTVTAVMEGM